MRDLLSFRDNGLDICCSACVFSLDCLNFELFHFLDMPSTGVFTIDGVIKLK